MTGSSGADLVVVGIGNILLGDDGVGVRVVGALAARAERDRAALPPGTRLVDGGTLGVELLATLEGSRALVVVDGIDVGARPGSVVLMRGEAIVAGGNRRSGGAAGGVGELLALAGLLGRLPQAVALVGVQVAQVGFDIGLSPAVAAAVQPAVDTVCRVAQALYAEADARPVPSSFSLIGAGA